MGPWSAADDAAFAETWAAFMACARARGFTKASQMPFEPGELGWRVDWDAPGWPAELVLVNLIPNVPNRSRMTDLSAYPPDIQKLAAAINEPHSALWLRRWAMRAAYSSDEHAMWQRAERAREELLMWEGSEGRTRTWISPCGTFGVVVPAKEDA